MKRPLILISNDDGYQSKGIHELVRMVSHLGDIIVSAPEGARSGQSRAFTTGDMTLRQLSRADGVTWYACSGTPVDSVKMAYALVCPRRPDLILSGINHGDNASTNAHYSGTVGVAFEGALKGIPAIAFSLCDYSADADFEPMHAIVESLCSYVLREGLPHQTCLNVNAPKVSTAADIKGVRLCRMADGYWHKEIADNSTVRYDAAGNIIYHYAGYYRCDEPEAADTDAWALAHGYAAVTPCTIDITSRELLRSAPLQAVCDALSVNGA